MFYEVKNKGNMIAAPINVYSTKRKHLAVWLSHSGISFF